MHLAASLTEEISGRIYCYLPMPTKTHLRVHLHANWAPSSDSTNVIIDDDKGAEIDRSKLNWNQYRCCQNFMHDYYMKWQMNQILSKMRYRTFGCIHQLLRNAIALLNMANERLKIYNKIVKSYGQSIMVVNVSHSMLRSWPKNLSSQNCS